MKLQKAAVIGHPIGHTMSPFIQDRLFSRAGIPLSYSVLDVPDLEKALPQLKELDCFNVTIPHKSAIIPFLDRVEEQAARFGSVNTVKVENGKLSGYTTDGAGCRIALERHGLTLSGKLLLLGSGGAARALAFEAAKQTGTDLTLACREGSRPKAAQLIHDVKEYAESRGNHSFRAESVTYEELCAGERERYELLLNATSVGMYPNAGSSPVSEKVVSRCAAVFDAVFNPSRTELIRLAERCGIQTVRGIEMLVYQAAAAHEIWYGSHFSGEELDLLCRDAEEEMKRIFGEEK